MNGQAAAGEPGKRKGSRAMGERTGWKKRFAAVMLGLTVVCLAAASLFWGCTRRKKEPVQEPVTLTLVYAYQNAQWNQGIQTIAEKFQQQYPDIRLEVQVQYEDKVYEDVLAKLQARGQMGDIIQLKTPERYAREGLLAPIEEEVAGLLENTSLYQETVYGVEALGSTSGILYNKDLFEAYGLQEPKTYGEFLEICEVLKAKGIPPVGVAGGDLWHLEFWVNHFFRTEIVKNVPDWLSERMAGRVSWQSEEGISMLTHLQQLFSGGYLNEDWQTALDGNLSYRMSMGEVAMMYTGSWTARELMKLNPGIRLGWFYLPDEEGNVVVSRNQDVYWCLTKECGEEEEKYRAALCFLEFFYGEEVYAGLCENTFGFPVTTEKADFVGTGIQKEIRDKFIEGQRHVTDYIGNDDTPQNFEKSLLNEVKQLADMQTDVLDTAQKLDALWEKYQEQEN